MYGTHYGRSINHGLVTYHFSNAKVGNLRIQVLIYQNILRFNIAVNNISAMSMLQSICQTHTNFQHCIQGELIVLQILFQGNAFNMFHDDIFFIAFGNYVVNINNVGMFQTSSRFCFPAELFQQSFIRSKLVTQHFDCYVAVKENVMCQINFCHATLSDSTEDFITSIQYGVFHLVILLYRNHNQTNIIFATVIKSVFQ